MNIQPLTIITDPFNGKYSQGKFLAFNEYANKIPSVFSYNDFALHFVFWDNYIEDEDGIIGIGNSIDDAISDLTKKLQDKKLSDFVNKKIQNIPEPIQYNSVSKELDELKFMLV